MKTIIQISTLALLCFLLCTNTTVAQEKKAALSRDIIEQEIISRIIKTQEIFQWEASEDHFLWSALIAQDSIVAIGFKPVGVTDIQSTMNRLDLTTPDWQQAKQEIEQYIWTKVQQKYGDLYARSYIFPESATHNLPFIQARVFDLDMIETIRAMETVTFFDPMGFTMSDETAKSDEGCSDYSAPLNTADYANISPMSRQSWHHSEHMIDVAWTKGPQGDGITIAVFDTGISSGNPKYNGQFTEGMSGGRTIVKKGFYDPSGGTSYDGWADGCGHGTAMAGLNTAPRGNDDSPAGIAYRSNLVSYRVTNDVLIGATAEKNGVIAAFNDVAADPSIDIVSMSLGDIFSNGAVTLAVQNAHAAGKLIFCAAGTSTSVTSWYGVIFPANLNETVAVTGVIEGTNFTRCDVCHDGNEVDFVVTMERSGSGNKALTTTNDNVNAPWYGYVGGSSAATASMAGIAALAWSNNMALTKDQLLNKLITSSSRYPNRDSDFGWGKVDACMAAAPSTFVPCSASQYNNSVTMEITSITFPSVSDTGSDAEWVVDINGNSYLFQVPESGATGNPNSYFVSISDCTASVPISINLGTTSCGQSLIPIVLETSEDDGASNDCDYDPSVFGGSDDEFNNSTVNVNFNATSFSAHGFTFEYTLSCDPVIWAAGLSDDSPACFGDPITFIGTPASEANYEFFLDANNNGVFDAGESVQTGPSANPDIYTNSSLTNGDVVGLVVTHTNGCQDTTLATANVSAANYAGINQLIGTQMIDADYETDGIIESDQIINSNAKVDYDSALEVNLFNGFETVNGVIFCAFIDGCNNGAGGINLTEDDSESNILNQEKRENISKKEEK